MTTAQQAREALGDIEHCLAGGLDPGRETLKIIRQFIDAAEGDAKDAARIQFLEDETMRGSAPNLVFDDDGNWCVSYSGMQPVPHGGGKGYSETVGITCIVEPDEWQPSVRAAIDAAMAGEG